MRNFAIAAFIWIGIAAPAAASSCEDLALAVEGSVKKIAELTMADGPDALNEMKKANSYSEIQSNLLLMQGNKCVMPKIPVDYRPYLTAALECTIAKSRAQRAGDKSLPVECDRDKWARQTEKTK